MSWYIGTLEECNAYNQKVNEAKQYKGSITNNWATPRKHPTEEKWAIIANSVVTSSLQSVEVLDESWDNSIQ